jgi:hypothetical protein
VGFRESWISRLLIEMPRLEEKVKNVKPRSVVSHISRKTCEIWGTRVRGRESPQNLALTVSLEASEALLSGPMQTCSAACFSASIHLR